MRLIIDIGHPGHVHYFRNLYFKLKEHNHEIRVFARNKEVTFELLDHYKIPFIQRGSGGGSFVGKFLNLISSAFIIFKFGLKFKPDIILSFASPYASLAAFFLGCSNIILDDTEAGRFERFVYRPLSHLIITPEAFKLHLGKKHFRFEGFMELSYLMSGFFYPDSDIPGKLGIMGKNKYVIIRFVSWEATHDRGLTGLSLKDKLDIVNLCKKFAKVYISSEKALPESLMEYQLNIEAHNLHDVLFYASMYIGEGATTAAEACMLGTPAVYINRLSAGTTEEQERKGLLFNFRSFEGVSDVIEKILVEKNKEKCISLSREMINNKIDLTSFLVWLLEEYPGSREVILKDPGYQRRFRHETCGEE